MKTLIVVAVLTVIFVLGVRYKIFGPSVKRSINEKKLNDVVEKVSKAKVISMMDTGERQERNPQLKLKLEIMPELRESFEVEVVTFVSLYQLSNFVPGSILSVKYDPKFPRSVVILK